MADLSKDTKVARIHQWFTIFGIPALLAISGWGAVTFVQMLTAQKELATSMVYLHEQQVRDHVESLERDQRIVHLIERLEDRLNGAKPQ